MRYLVLCLIFLSACSMPVLNIDFGTKEKALQTKLLYRLEERDMEKSKIIEYRVHENGLVFKTVDSLKTKIYKASPDFMDEAKKLIAEVSKVDYHNYFPWKEDLSEKGDIINIEFPGIIKLNCFKQNIEKSKCKDGFAAKTYLYYTGHEESPKVFAELLAFTKSI